MPPIAVLCCTPGAESFNATRPPSSWNADRVVLIQCKPSSHDGHAAPPKESLRLVLGEPATRLVPASVGGDLAQSRGTSARRRERGGHRNSIRSPAIAGTPDSANRQAAASSSSSGSVAATMTGTGLTAAPARMPSSTASQLSAALPLIPGGRS